MNKKTLVYARGLFLLIIIVSLGLIIVNEKKGELLSHKIDKKFNSYIETNFAGQDFKKSNITFKNNIFKIKLSHPKNDNHYFYLTYSNGDLKDTYQKDYVEGNNLLNTNTEEIQNSIKEKTTIDCEVIPTNSLNEYNSLVQDKIINNDTKDLKYYYIKKELVLDNFKEDNIVTEITKIISKISKDFTPKYYSITIIDKNDITKTIEINNLTEDFINNINNKQIIKDILDNKNSELVQKSKITFKYMN